MAQVCREALEGHLFEEERSYDRSVEEVLASLPQPELPPHRSSLRDLGLEDDWLGETPPATANPYGFSIFDLPEISQPAPEPMLPSQLGFQDVLPPKERPTIKLEFMSRLKSKPKAKPKSREERTESYGFKHSTRSSPDEWGWYDQLWA